MNNEGELILSLIGNAIGAGLGTAFVVYMLCLDTFVADYWLYIYIPVFILILGLTIAIAISSVHRENKRFEKELQEQYDFIDSL